MPVANDCTGASPVDCTGCNAVHLDAEVLRAPRQQDEAGDLTVTSAPHRLWVECDHEAAGALVVRVVAHATEPDATASSTARASGP